HRHERLPHRHRTQTRAAGRPNRRPRTSAALSRSAARRPRRARDRRARVHHRDPAPAPEAAGRTDPARRPRLVSEGSGRCARRLDEIRLLPTSANRQPALAAYARGDDGKHRPYGLMVLQTENDLIEAIVGFPDPWLFEQGGLPPELT